MSEVKSYLGHCVLQLAGVVAKENATNTRMVVRPMRDPQGTELTVNVSACNGDVTAKISGQVNGETVEQTCQVIHWELLPAAVVALLPAAIFTMEGVSVEFSGEYADGSAVTPAFGNSLSQTIVKGQAPREDSMQSATTTTAAIEQIIDQSVAAAVEYTVSGTGHYAQICVIVGNTPRWVNLDSFEHDGELLNAATNDGDLLIGAPPTFVERAVDPATMHQRIKDFLCDKLAGCTDNVVVRVVRRNTQGSDPDLVGSAESGCLVERTASGLDEMLL